MEKSWQLDVAFSHSVAVYRGHVGPNNPHSHWASQLTIGIDGGVEFETEDSGRVTAEAVYLASKVKHQLFSGLVCSIYFDPLCAPRTRIGALGEGVSSGWTALTVEQLPKELRCLSESTDLRALLDSDILRVGAPASVTDARFRRMARELAEHVRTGHELDRDDLARSMNLSPSRFSHWFVEQTGIPLRSYKKWLKLRLAMEALMAGENATHAAMSAGFSDLAHMSRAFSESFGLTYLDALHAWQHAQKR
jgi:AraC-like DNA-binding protein